MQLWLIVPKHLIAGDYIKGTKQMIHFSYKRKGTLPVDLVKHEMLIKCLPALFGKEFQKLLS